MRSFRRYALGALIAAATPATAMPWIVTQYYEVEESTIVSATVIGDVTFSADVWTQTNAISLTQTPAPSPIAAKTTVQTVYDLTIVSEVLPSSAGKTINPFAPLPMINYYIPLTYNAPKTCHPGWSHTTSAVVLVPYEVTPTPIATLPPSTDEGLGQNFLIAASEIPSSSLSSLSSAYGPYYSSLCQIPSGASIYGSSPTFAAGGGSNDGLGDSCVSMELLFGGSPVGGGYDCDDGMHWTWGLSLAGLICIWIFSFFGFFFFAGLLENWFTFRSLCRGHAARRGLPISWAFMFPFLSCFFLIGSDRGFVAKPVDEQQVLQRRWDDLGAGTKLGQWLSWGFRWNYPSFLGPTPPRKGTVPNVQVVNYHGPPQMTQYPPQEQGAPPYMQHPPVVSMNPYGNSPPPMQQSPYGSPQPQQMSPYGSSPTYTSPTLPTGPTPPYGTGHVGYK